MKISATTKVLALLATMVIVAPLFSLLAKAPWSHFFSSLTDLTAIKLSLWTSFLAAAIMCRNMKAEMMSGAQPTAKTGDRKQLIPLGRQDSGFRQ